MLALSCSADAFAASFAYGGKRIRIPPLSGQIINLTCSAFLGAALLLGATVRKFLSARLTAFICFAVLFTLGIMKLLDSITKSVIRKRGRRGGSITKEIRFSMLNFSFVLSLCADPEKADVDENKIISPAEAAALAVSLSIDGLAVGFGAGIGNINVLAAVAVSLLTDMAAITFGCRLGGRLARALPFNLSWISGVILIGLAVLKLV